VYPSRCKRKVVPRAALERAISGQRPDFMTLDVKIFHQHGPTSTDGTGA